MSIPVGYTSDGKVFLTFISEYDGVKYQTIATMSPDDAVIMADEIKGAAEEARKKAPEKEVAHA
jgi:hypothetical protein